MPQLKFSIFYLMLGICLSLQPFFQPQQESVLVSLCRYRIQSEQPLEEWVGHRLLLVDALRHHDLSAAVAEAQVNATEFEAQKATVNDWAIAVLDWAELEASLDASSDQIDEVAEALFYFDDATATCDQQIHFYTSLISYEIFREADLSELEEPFSLLKSAYASCENPHLVANSILQVVNNLTGKYSPLLTQAKALELIDAQADFHADHELRFLKEKLKGEKWHEQGGKIACKKSIECFNKCLEIAEESKSNLLMYLANRDLGISLQLTSRENEAMSCYLDSSKNAKDLNDVTRKLAVESHVSALLQKQGKLDSSLAVLTEMFKEDQLVRASVRMQQGVIRQTAHAFGQVGEEQKSAKLLELADDHKTLSDRREQRTRLVNTVIEKVGIETALISARKTTEEISNKVLVVEKATSAYRNLLNIVLTVLAFVLGAGFVYSVRREFRFKEQLHNEREMSRDEAVIRRRLENKVSHMQKMQSLGMLAGGVAHDFNNLLVGVMCNAEVIMMHSSDEDGFVKERTHQIIRSAEKAANLSQQMLKYAGKHQIERVPVNLNSLVRKLYPILKSAGGMTKELRLALDEKPVVAEIDATQAEQVLINLVTNARKASGNKAEVIIRSGVETVNDFAADPNIVGANFEPGQYVYFEVEDFGCGISEENLQRIYEPFYSEREGGRGLGLSVVYGIVEGHEGLIRTESTIGKGTRIRILLPQSAELAGDSFTFEESDEFSSDNVLRSIRTDAGNSQVPSPKFSSRRLLVVDDERSVLNSTKDLLSLEGWKIDAVSHGREAIELLKEDDSEFRGMLLDVTMPEMDGNEVLANMIESQLKTPVVIMSGFSQTRLDEYLVHPLVVAVVRKPFRMREIVRALDELPVRG